MKKNIPGAIQSLESLKDIPHEGFKQKQLNFIRTSFGLESISFSAKQVDAAINQTKYELGVQSSNEGFLDFFKKKIPFGSKATLEKDQQLPVFVTESSKAHYDLLLPLTKGRLPALDKMINEASKVNDIEVFVKVIRSNTTKEQNRLVVKGLKYHQIYPTGEALIRKGETITFPTEQQFKVFGEMNADQIDLVKQAEELFQMWQDYIFDDENEGAEDHYKDVHDFLATLSNSEGDSAIKEAVKAIKSFGSAKVANVSSNEGFLDFFKKKTKDNSTASIPFGETVILNEDISVPRLYAKNPKTFILLYEVSLDEPQYFKSIAQISSEFENGDGSIESLDKSIKKNTKVVNGKMIPKDMEYDQIYGSTNVTLNKGAEFVFPTAKQMEELDSLSVRDYRLDSEHVTSIRSTWEDAYNDLDDSERSKYAKVASFVYDLWEVKGTTERKDMIDFKNTLVKVAQNHTKK